MGIEAWKLAMSGKGSSNGVQRVRSSKKTESSADSSSSTSARSKTAKNKTNSRKSKARPTISRSLEAEERKWRAESDLRALTEANEILESPERVKAAKRIAQERVEVARAAADSIDNL